MLQQIFDLHIHSKYSRACSKELALPVIAKTCETRGIDIAATGDFTHPKWFEHIREELMEVNEGVYQIKENVGLSKKQDTRNKIQGGRPIGNTKFILGTEIASIKKHKGQTRRVHLLLFAPSIESAGRFNTTLEDRGFNLRADGRPILGLTCHDILELALEIDPRMVVIPAHAWTPWFGVFGSKGGYDTLEGAFDDLTPHVRAIETGLSSDPFMNWHCSFLDRITMISNSDAHSPAKLGREANVLQFGSKAEITYNEIMRIIQEGDRKKFKYTVEFYPEEGKYHMDGHRACGVSFYPNETKKYKGICPKCKKPLVIGVMNRVMELADRTEEEARAFGASQAIPYKSLVPLQEIIADTLQKGWNTKTVEDTYHDLIGKLGNEFHILLEATLADIEVASTKQLATAIDRVRCGDIHIVPGYDGEFGVVKVFGDGEERGGVRQGMMKL